MRYRTIVADPPWRQKAGPPWASNGKSRDLEYSTMSVAEIAAIPVKEIAEDDAHLYLWVTNRYVEQSYGIARAWGFKPIVLLTWGKEPMGLGLGGTFVQTSEHILFARRGRDLARGRIERTWWNWPRQGRHSQKPEQFFDLVEAVSPGPYLEMFARRNRLFWDTWGNECHQNVDL
jgi:N6-adenosine-specific RNA methylase IME4